MPLAPGQTLLHYRVVDKIGEGGMGEVWRAVDTTLDREVAIKILPEAFARNPDRLARFEREAKLLASLNHPGIATVFGVHEFDGTRFLAMELVAGEDLAQRLARGRLSIDETTAVGRQIAEALEAAHDRGVVHRDLKPANVRLTSDGKVKVLDFGLAKAMASDPSPHADRAHSPTMTSAGSVVGVLLGTAAYMSPEQARGHDVDERTDIWSFGCVLWECLTGARPFAGRTVSDSLAAILTTEPDPARLPARTPAAMRRVLRRCLAKDPHDRLHHIADARIELQSSQDDTAATTDATRGYRRAIAVLLIVVLAALGMVVLQYIRPAPDPSNAPATNPLAGARFSKITDFAGSEYDAAISPDGQFVAFVSERDGPFEIYFGQIGTNEFRKMASGGDQFALKDARAPVRSVGFNGDGSELWLGGGPWRRIRTAPLLGGPLRNFLGDDAVSVAWSPDGERVVYHDRTAGDPLHIADGHGSNIRPLLAPPAGTHQHYPVWSTDGAWIYVSRGRPATGEMDLWRVPSEGGEPEQMTVGKLDVRYPTPIDDDTVLYSARDSDGAGPWLWALDVATGSSRRATVGLEQYISVSASDDGLRLVATVQDSRAELWTVPILDRVATEQDARRYSDLATPRALSPRFGGSSLFFLSSQGSGDGLWRHDDGKVSEIWRGSEIALLEPAAVSADGQTVALLLRKPGGWWLHTMEADGTGLERLTDRVDARGAAAWSPDGAWIAIGGFVDGVEGLFKIPTDGGEPVRIADGESLNPVWSPDGTLIAYTGAQVNVVSPLLAVRPDGEPVELPEIDVFRWGARMRFLPDGSGLVVMVKGYEPSQDFWLLDLATMTQRRLTELESSDTMMTFDITPDGKTIVFDRLGEDSDIVLIER